MTLKSFTLCNVLWESNQGFLYIRRTLPTPLHPSFCTTPGYMSHNSKGSKISTHQNVALVLLEKSKFLSKLLASQLHSTTCLVSWVWLSRKGTPRFPLKTCSSPPVPVWIDGTISCSYQSIRSHPWMSRVQSISKPQRYSEHPAVLFFMCEPMSHIWTASAAVNGAFTGHMHPFKLLEYLLFLFKSVLHFTYLYSMRM